MNFSKSIRHTSREITPRRLAAAARALRKQADAVALFPELQPKQTPAERCTKQDESTAIWWQSIRDYRAQTWRSARRELRAMTPEQQAEVLRWFNVGPKDASYLADAVHTVKRQTL
jgi:hypothetical protein